MSLLPVCTPILGDSGGASFVMAPLGGLPAVRGTHRAFKSLYILGSYL